MLEDAENSNITARQNPQRGQVFIAISPSREIVRHLCLSAAVVLLVITRRTNKCYRGDALVEQRAIEGRELFLDKVLITALGLNKVFLNRFENGRSRVGARIVHTAGDVARPRT